MKDVDCPELAQPFGQQVKKQASDLYFGGTVTVETTGKDRHDRTLSHIILLVGNQEGRALVRQVFLGDIEHILKDETLGR